MEPFMSTKEDTKNKKDGGEDGPGGSKDTKKIEGGSGAAESSTETRKEGGGHGGGGVLSNFFFSGKEEIKPNIKEDVKPTELNEPGTSKSVAKVPRDELQLNIAKDESQIVRTDEQNQRPTCESLSNNPYIPCINFLYHTYFLDVAYEFERIKRSPASTS